MIRLLRLPSGGPADAPDAADDRLAEDAVVERLASVLEAGGVALMPTDTVYGLAAAATADGVGALAEIKGRDADKPVAVLVATPSAGLGLFDRPSASLVRLAEAAWPGPVTLVAPAGSAAPPAMRSEGTVGVRCPDYRLVRRVAERVGPMAVTSANPAGAEPLRSLDGLEELARRWPELRSVGCAVDGGPLPGTASTVVLVPASEGGTPTVLRTGPIAEERISRWWDGGAVGHTLQ